MYYGRPSEYLLMTSERMDIPDGMVILQQVLDSLKLRGGRWAYKLDDGHVICTAGQKVVALSETIGDGDEVGIFSRKSLFEM